MLKIKDENIEKLKDFGFIFTYDTYTGKPIEVYKFERPILSLKGLRFKKKKIIRIFKNNKYIWELDNNVLVHCKTYETYSYDFDTLYDLIQSGLVEKIEEE